MNSKIKPFKIAQKFDAAARTKFAEKIFNELRELSADTVGVTSLTLAKNFIVPDVASEAGYNADGDIPGYHHGTLFNMEFNVGRYVFEV